MKKIVLVGILFLSIASAIYGQKSKVNTAYNLVVVAPADFDAAITNINAALEDPSTKDWVKTWYTAGFIYDKIVDDQKIKASFNAAEENKELRGESVLKAYDYFVKAEELDNLPDEKGKINPKYTKQIISAMKLYPAELFNYGVTKYGDEAYAEAVSIWEKYLNMPNISFLKNAGIEKDSMYIIAMYYTATAAVLSNDTDTAIKYYEKVKDLYSINESYQFLAQQYLNEKKDTVSYLKTIKTGLKKYPTNSFFLGSLIDYYIYFDENIDSALIYVNEAIQANPEMADNYFIRGAIFETKKEDEAATKDFLKAIEINPEHDRALSAVGNYYVRKGDEQMRSADKTKDPILEKEGRNKALELYKEAIPHLEKARTINPKNRANLMTLRSVYYKIYKDDKNPKYIEINTAIEAL